MRYHKLPLMFFFRAHSLPKPGNVYVSEDDIVSEMLIYFSVVPLYIMGERFRKKTQDLTWDGLTAWRDMLMVYLPNVANPTKMNQHKGIVIFISDVKVVYGMLGHFR